MPQQFAQAQARQAAILNDPDIEIAIIPANDIIVSVFNQEGNSPDPAIWANVVLAQFYNKKQVAIYPDGFDPTQYSPPVFDPEPVTLALDKDGDVYTFDAFRYQNRYSLTSLAYELHNTPYSFGVDVNGTQITVKRNSSVEHVQPEPKPKQLDAVSKYTIDIDGKKLIRSGFEIGGEPHFTLAQISQILGLEISLLGVRD